MLPIICCQQADILRLLLRVLPDEGLNEESEEEGSSGGAHSPQLLNKKRMRSLLDLMSYWITHPHN